MRIATLNVNGINGRLAVLLRWLEQTRPHVVCLKELKAPDERFPIGEIEKAGYGAIWHGQKIWNGVAILSRYGQPIETQRRLPGDPDDSQSRYIEAAVAGMVIVASFAWLDMLSSWAREVWERASASIVGYRKKKPGHSRAF